MHHVQQNSNMLLWLWAAIATVAMSLAVAIWRISEQRDVRSARLGRANRAGRLLKVHRSKSSDEATAVVPRQLSAQAAVDIPIHGALLPFDEPASGAALNGTARERRVSGDFHARMRQAGAKSIEVRVWDLSAGGFRVEWPHKMQRGDRVWLMVSGTTSLAALVAWTEEFVIGCKFEERVHGAVLNTIVTRAQGDR